MGTKFSFIINEMGNDLYVIIMSSWTLDEEGNKLPGNVKTLSSLALDECMVHQAKFINDNKK